MRCSPSLRAFWPDQNAHKGLGIIQTSTELSIISLDLISHERTQCKRAQCSRLLESRLTPWKGAPVEIPPAYPSGRGGNLSRPVRPGR